MILSHFKCQNDKNWSKLFKSWFYKDRIFPRKRKSENLLIPREHVYRDRKKMDTPPNYTLFSGIDDVIFKILVKYSAFTPFK